MGSHDGVVSGLHYNHLIFSFFHPSRRALSTTVVRSTILFLSHRTLHFQLLLTLVLYFSGSSSLLFVGRWVEDASPRSEIEQRRRMAGYGAYEEEDSIQQTKEGPGDRYKLNQDGA